MKSKVFNIGFKDKNGELKTLNDFPASVYVIVNVASKCGLTPQYKELEDVYKRYKDKGLEILGFPSNNFANQEPGTNEEIQEFCNLNYDVTFPINEKIDVRGENIHPLYEELIKYKKEAVKNPEGNLERLLIQEKLLKGKVEDVKWNFEKFILDSNGNVLERYFPDIKIIDDRMIRKIEENLN